MCAFLLTKSTGTFQFNVREGKILGGEVRKHIKA